MKKLLVILLCLTLFSCQKTESEMAYAPFPYQFTSLEHEKAEIDFSDLKQSYVDKLSKLKYANTEPMIEAIISYDFDGLDDLIEHIEFYDRAYEILLKENKRLTPKRILNFDYSTIGYYYWYDPYDLQDTQDYVDEGYIVNWCGFWCHHNWPDWYNNYFNTLSVGDYLSLDGNVYVMIDRYIGDAGNGYWYNGEHLSLWTNHYLLCCTDETGDTVHIIELEDAE